MLPKIIPILGAKWDKVLERWANGRGRTFQAVHDKYINMRLGRAKLVPPSKKNRKGV